VKGGKDFSLTVDHFSFAPFLISSNQGNDRQGTQRKESVPIKTSSFKCFLLANLAALRDILSHAKAQILRPGGSRQGAQRFFLGKSSENSCLFLS
jgi:hypothetical protein